MRDAFCRSMGAMRAAEGVVHVDVAETGKLFREGRIVGFFFGVKAQIFEQQHLARFELSRKFERDLADAIGRECDVD